MKATKRILAVIIGITTVFCCASCLNKNPSAPENRMQEVKPLADVELSEKEAVRIVDGKRFLILQSLLTVRKQRRHNSPCLILRR